MATCCSAMPTAAFRSITCGKGPGEQWEVALVGWLRVGEQALDTKASENTDFNSGTPSVAAGMGVDIVTWGSWSNAGQDIGWFVTRAAPGGLF